jgi:hypothetical protein
MCTHRVARPRAVHERFRIRHLAVDVDGHRLQAFDLHRRQLRVVHAVAADVFAARAPSSAMRAKSFRDIPSTMQIE